MKSYEPQPKAKKWLKIRDELLTMNYIIKIGLIYQISDFGHSFLKRYMEKTTQILYILL